MDVIAASQWPFQPVIRGQRRLVEQSSRWMVGRIATTRLYGQMAPILLAARIVGAVVVSAKCFSVPTGRVLMVSVTSTQMARGRFPILRRWPMLFLFTLMVNGELSVVQVRQLPSGRQA